MDDLHKNKNYINNENEKRFSFDLTNTEQTKEESLATSLLTQSNANDFASTKSSSSSSSIFNGHNLKDYKILKLIGEGSYGKVLLVKHIQEDKLYAMKVLKKAELAQRSLENKTKLEQAILASFNHPNVVRLAASFQTNSRLFLVLEYCPGIS